MTSLSFRVSLGEFPALPTTTLHTPRQDLWWSFGRIPYILLHTVSYDVIGLYSCSPLGSSFSLSLCSDFSVSFHLWFILFARIILDTLHAFIGWFSWYLMILFQLLLFNSLSGSPIISGLNSFSGLMLFSVGKINCVILFSFSDAHHTACVLFSEAVGVVMFFPFPFYFHFILFFSIVVSLFLSFSFSFSL